MNLNFNKINETGSFGGSSFESFLRQACPAFMKPEAWWPKSPDLNLEEVNPLDFLLLSELEQKVYGGQKINIIEKLKTMLRAAASGTRCSSDSLLEQ